MIKKVLKRGVEIRVTKISAPPSLFFFLPFSVCETSFSPKCRMSCSLEDEMKGDKVPKIATNKQNTRSNNCRTRYDKNALRFSQNHVIKA